MITRIILYLFALADFVVFYIFYQEWVSWIVLVAVIGLPWLSLAVSLPAMLTFQLEPEAPARLKIGDAARMRMHGTCAMPHPPVKMKIQLTRPITGECWMLRLGEKLPTDHCGGLIAQPVRAGVYDYLGLFRMKPRKTGAVTTLVMPQMLKMQVPPDLSRYLARSWRPKPGGGFSENHELRLYRPGDSLNQVHWKLSAKTGKLILREPMEPVRGLMLLTLDISGTAQELDRKFGRLLWLGTYLLEQNVRFEIRAMTGKGLESWPVASEPELQKAMEDLLCSGQAAGSVLEHSFAASWQYHVGGGPDEA
ncbi:MAG: DUF58 domain-containing protein [Oscillospiraceae bacterium]|nr:DUF58 domain-containing protein [Oscillospiraceae bacterium]